MPLVIKTVVINRALFSSRNNWIQSEVSCNPQRLLSMSWHHLEAKEETDNILHEKLSLQPPDIPRLPPEGENCPVRFLQHLPCQVCRDRLCGDVPYPRQPCLPHA